jgi:two-component SAPR family response regulator
LDNAIEADEETVRLGEDTISLDVAALRSLIAACQKHGHPDSVVCDLCLNNLTDAVDLYRGDFLAGFSIPDCPEFEEWQFFETEALRRDMASALSRLVLYHSAKRDFERAISYARRWLSLDPLQEDVHRQLMQLYDWAGQRSAALRQYEVCTKLLQTEMQVQPEAATIQLHAAIQAGNHQPRLFSNALSQKSYMLGAAINTLLIRSMGREQSRSSGSWGL